MAIPTTTGERPRNPATVPAGKINSGIPGQASDIPVARGAKERLLAGETVDVTTGGERLTLGAGTNTGE